MHLPFVPSAILCLTLGLTGAALADPPGRAGNGNGKATPHASEHHDRMPRFSSHDRKAMHRYIRHYSGETALPPGLRKNVARGKPLPPGWRKKLYRGGYLSDDLLRLADPLPSMFYSHGLRRPGRGYSDVVIDNRAIRILDASRLIVDVFALDR